MKLVPNTTPASGMSTNEPSSSSPLCWQGRDETCADMVTIDLFIELDRFTDNGEPYVRYVEAWFKLLSTGETNAQFRVWDTSECMFNKQCAWMSRSQKRKLIPWREARVTLEARGFSEQSIVEAALLKQREVVVEEIVELNRRASELDRLITGMSKECGAVRAFLLGFVDGDDSESV